MTRTISNALLIAVFAFLGGFAAQILQPLASPALAQALEKASYFMLKDQANPRGYEAYVMGGYPAQNFYGKDGKIRLQHGIYSAPGEAGLPLVAMSGNTGQLKMLFRLAGPNESPVIIMKDSQSRDRVVFGLDLGSPGEEPFLATFDKDGVKTMHFGNY